MSLKGKAAPAMPARCRGISWLLFLMPNCSRMSFKSLFRIAGLDDLTMTSVEFHLEASNETLDRRDAAVSAASYCHMEVWTQNDANGLSTLGLENHVRQKDCFKLCCWKNSPLYQDQTNGTQCHCCSWSKVVWMPFSKNDEGIQTTFISYHFQPLCLPSLQAAAIRHLNIWFRCLCCSSNACWLYKLAPACEKRRLLNVVKQ